MTLTSLINTVLHHRSIRLAAQPAVCTAAKGSRIEFIDLAKGVCILLVVLLHSEVLPFDLPNFKAVRMPLYFILSGLFFRDYGNIAVFLEKKINRMVVPFLFFIFLNLAIYFAIQLLVTGQPIHWEWLYMPFTDRIYVNYPLWFLICLFNVNVIFSLIYRLTRISSIQMGMCLACAATGYYLFRQGIQLPLHLDTALTAMPFFCAGRLLAGTTLFFPNRYDNLSMPLGIGLCALSFLIYSVGGTQCIDFLSNQYFGALPLIYLNSLLFTIGIMMICKSIGHLPVISYMGRYSIIILCTHYLYLLNIGTVLNHFVDPVTAKWGTIFGMTILLCFTIPLCRRYLPRFTAQKDLIHIVK